MMVLNFKGIGTRNSMQDAGFANTSKNDNLQWFIVCDGIGGTPFGDVAAQFIVKVVDEYFSNTLDKESQLSNSVYVNSIFEYIQAQLLSLINENPQYKNMGCTLCILILSEYNLYALWSGDSRVYQFRNDECIWDSIPHNWPYDLYKKGVLTLEDARVSETNYITGSVSYKSDPIRYDFSIQKVKSNDLIMICTDGIWGLFEHFELIEMFSDKTLFDLELSLNKFLKKYSNDNYYGYIIKLP